MKRRIPSAILLLLMLSLLSGCMPQSGKAPEPFYYYTLDYPPPSLSLGARLPIVLRVERFSVSPPFNNQRIYYADKGTYRNSYARQQWIASPDLLLPYLLARDLRSANGFQAVLPPDAAVNATHTLNGWIEEMLEVDSTSPPAASLKLNITVISAHEPDPSKRIVFQKTYTGRSDCVASTPAALADAMSRAMARISSDVAVDVYRELSGAETH